MAESSKPILERDLDIAKTDKFKLDRKYLIKEFN